MIGKLLTEYHLELLSLKGGCRGSSVSTHVKMPHCWKSHAYVHIIGEYLQCESNHYAKFKNKGMKTVGVAYHTNQTPSTHFGGTKCLTSTSPKMKIICLTCAQIIKGAHI